MGCGNSKASQPKPAPARRAAGAPRSNGGNGSVHGHGGGGGSYVGGSQPVIIQDRPYTDLNGSVDSYGRRLSLVSEGSEDELRCTELLQGNVNMAREDTSRVVRVFTSSTFTDTYHERNALMEKVYPRLKEYTQEQGYDFQVVDMRWGIREAASDDHMTTEICMRELKACQRLSTGPNFVTFLSHKYGHRPLARLIDSDKFEMMLSGVTEPAAKQLLQKWYRRDDNAVPASFVLQPISTHLPEFTSKDPDVFREARDTWWRQCDVMQEALSSAAQRTLTDSAESHKFLSSVTEKEIEAGILQAQDPEEHCLWFRRNIQDIDNQEPDRLLSRYTECLGEEKAISETKDLLHNLKDHLIPRKLPNDCVISYNVPWTKKAIDPTSCRSHAEYLDQLCSDFEFHIKTKIQQAIKKRNQSQLGEDPLTVEISQHALFCQSKTALFHGRQTMIDKIETYLVTSIRYPLVLHGESGCGKTSLMAVAAQRAWELYKGKALVILRFIGTTPDSSSIRTLLYSIISQIRRLFQDEKPVPTDMKDLVEEFNTVLHLASAEQPMVIVLDSLDQFSTDNNARQLFWLPGKLPRHVKMLLSTLPGDEYECYPRLKMILQKSHHFLAMSELTSTDGNGILCTWLEKGSRTLQPSQRQSLLDAFSKCSLPLYLKLCFDEACRWPSYMEPSQAQLQTTIEDSIRALFARIERSHGELLVSRVLGYITISRTGLSETELEDVLSCDDDVLNDVYQFWTPPLRRLPPLLAIRVKNDLSEYLVDRGAESVTVTYWYHRQFVQVARTLYCTDNRTVQLMHTNLSEYYRGVWADKPKPYTDPKTGEDSQALRHVARQPYKFDSRYNLRKLMELPIHVIEAEQLTVLKDEVLCNLKWLTAKIEATSLRHVLDDFSLARSKYPDDEDLKTVSEVLQLSQKALNQDPHQLPGQLLGRISQGNNKLTAQCCRPPYPALIPSEVLLKEPGGQLLHIMSEHSNEVNALDLSQDGRFAVTCSDDHTVKLWDIKAGKLHKSIDNVGDQPSFLRFCCNDQCVVVVDSKHVYLINLDTSQVKVIDDNSIQLSGANVFKFLVFNGGSTLAVPLQKGVAFLELPSGSHLYTVTDPFLKSKGVFGSFSDILDGHKDYIAISGSANAGSTLHYEVHILDVKQQKFVHCVTLFQAPQHEDEEEYTVDALAVTHDETLVIAAEMLSNNLHFISVESGTVIRKLIGDPEDSSDLFHITPDDRYLYFCNIDKLCVWDLETGDRSYTLHHASRAADIQTRDQQYYVSISVDQVCIWDITRTDSHQPIQNKEDSYSVGCMLSLPHTDRYIVVKKVSNAESDPPSLLCLYDVLQEEYIRTIKFPRSNRDMRSLHVTEDDRAIMVYNDSVVIINIKDNTHKVCQGKLPKYDSSICPLKSKTWFLTFTRGRLKVKVYNWLTGKVEFILGADQSFKLEVLEVSSQGNLAAAAGDSYPIFIFDLASKSVRHKIFMSVDRYTPYDVKMSSDGRMLIQTVGKQDEDGEISVTMECALVFDTKSGHPTHQLVDWDSYRRVEAEHTDEELSIVTFLSYNDIILTSHYDHNVRVWNANTGALVQCLPLPVGEDATFMEVTPDGSRLVTITNREQLMLWDMRSWHKVASYTMDTEGPFRHCVAIGDGSLILLKSETKDKFDQLRLVGNGIKPKRDQRRLKEIYKPNPKLDEKILTFHIPESEPDDPDLECEEVSSIDSEEEDGDDNDNSFTMNSDIPALSQVKNLDDLDLGGTHDLDLDLSGSDDDLADETKTMSTKIYDSFTMKTSAKSKNSERY